MPNAEDSMAVSAGMGQDPQMNITPDESVIAHSATCHTVVQEASCESNRSDY
jgi:hypothetical protein